MAYKSVEIKDRERPPSAERKAQDGSGFDALLQAVGRNKDRDAFVTLFEHFAPRIKSFLIKGGMSMEEADELAQETMLTVWNKSSAFDPGRAAASTWIFTIARNKKIDFIRKASLRGTEEINDNMSLGETINNPREDLMRSQETALIAGALDTLPEEQAMLIQKSFFEGKSHGDIAAETGIPLGTVKSRIRAALDRLRGNSNVKELR